MNYVKGIGEGWFGRVLQGDGKDLLPGYRKSKVVVLELNESADPHDQLNFLLEASAYREVQHENVLKLHGQCVERTPFLLVLEHCTFVSKMVYLKLFRDTNVFYQFFAIISITGRSQTIFSRSQSCI